MSKILKFVKKEKKKVENKTVYTVTVQDNTVVVNINTITASKKVILSPKDAAALGIMLIAASKHAFKKD